MACCCAEIDPQSKSAARTHIRNFIVGYSSVKLWALGLPEILHPAVGNWRDWKIMDFAFYRISHAARPLFARRGPCEFCVLLHPSHKKVRPWFCRLHIDRY